MLTILTGAAGSGKTRRICEMIREQMPQKKNMVLLTPEQQSHRAERQLAAVCGPGLSLCGEVLSFTRMYNRAAVELGGLADTLPDRGGRLLLMALALEDAGSRLEYMRSRGRRADFLRCLLATAEELESAMVSGDDLRAAAAQTSGTIAKKLEEMALVLDAWEAVQKRQLGDSRDAVARLADGIADCSVGAGGVYADGFTDFTARELAVLEGLLRRGTDVTVALTLPAGGDPAFSVTEETCRSLMEMAARRGVKAVLQRLPDPAPDPIRYLAANLWRYDAPPLPPGEMPAEVCRMDSFGGECRWAAARIRELMLEDESLRWGDFAVAVPDFPSRRGMLSAVFREYGLPAYVEEAEPLAPRSLAVYLLEALRTVTEGWRPRSLFRCLRTGFGPLTAGETDELENYCLTWNLRGETVWRQAEPWDLPPGGYGDAGRKDGEILPRVNALRQKLALPFGRLADAVKGSMPAGKLLRALGEFLEETGVRETLIARADTLEKAGDAAGAAACAGDWGAVTACLREMEAALGGLALSGEDFTRLLELLFLERQVGAIPAALDCVSLGSPARLRNRKPRVLLILGADDDALPGLNVSQGLFSPEEKRTLFRLGIRLDRGEDDALTRPLLDLYLLAASPKERLLVSWSGPEGVRPSILAEQAMGLLRLPLATEKKLAGRQLAASSAPALSLAMGSGPWAEAARACLPAGTLAELHAAAAQPRLPLQPETAKRLYGSPLRLTPSRAERWFGCSYRYFLEYGLRAKARQGAEFSAPQRGSFYHDILENVCREVQAGAGFAAVSEEALRKLTRKYAEAYAEANFRSTQLRDRRFRYLFHRLCESAETIVLTMAEQLAAGEFRPRDFELNFSDRDGDLPPFRLGDLLVEGKVDRVDVWERGGLLYLCVADYKSGPKSFSLSKVFEGQSIQMLIYLFMLTAEGEGRYGKRIVPGGVLYLPVRDELVKLPRDSSEERIRKERDKGRKASGLLLDEPSMLRARERNDPPRFLPVKYDKDGLPVGGTVSARQMQLLETYVQGLLLRMGEELRAGKAEASPLAEAKGMEPCRYCDYAGICGFDPKREKLRYPRRLTDAEFWALAEETGRTFTPAGGEEEHG